MMSAVVPASKETKVDEKIDGSGRKHFWEPCSVSFYSVLYFVWRR